MIIVMSTIIIQIKCASVSLVIDYNFVVVIGTVIMIYFIVAVVIIAFIIVIIIGSSMDNYYKLNILGLRFCNAVYICTNHAVIPSSCIWRS